MLILLMIALAGFCLFGAAATLEPPGWIALRIVYLSLAAALMAGSIALLVWRRGG